MLVQITRRWPLCRWLLLPALCLSSGAMAQAPGATEQSKDEGPLTLREALGRSLEHSPQLAEFPYRARVAEARTLQSGLRPNPELSFDVENLAGSGRFEGTDSAEVTLALSQVIELGGKRRQRETVATLTGARVQRAYERARVEVLADTAGRFLQVERAERQLTLARTAEALAKEVEQAVRERVATGHSNDADHGRARIARLRSELAVSAAERSLAIQRRNLAESWGSTAASFGEVQADLFALPAVPDYAALMARLEDSPVMAELLTRERLREAQWHLARAQGRQDLRVGAGIKHFADTGDHAFTLSASIPLGVRDRNQGEARARRAEFEQLASERRALQVTLDNALHRAYQTLLQRRSEAQVLRTRALPEAERALERVREGYARGRYSYLELTEVQRERLSLERDAIDAATAFFDALYALERLTGEPLTEPSAQARDSAEPVSAEKAPKHESR